MDVNSTHIYGCEFDPKKCVPGDLINWQFCSDLLYNFLIHCKIVSGFLDDFLSADTVTLTLELLTMRSCCYGI